MSTTSETCQSRVLRKGRQQYELPGEGDRFAGRNDSQTRSPSETDTVVQELRNVFLTAYADYSELDEAT